MRLFLLVPATARESTARGVTSWLILLLCAVAAVGLFVLGMSLTLMIKGHHIDSEISTNKNMQRLGIRCAVQESREDSGQTDCADAGCSGNCSACEKKRSDAPLFRINRSP